MRMNPYLKTSLRALGVYFLTIITGLVVYDSPPESLTVFWQWMWLPNLQGLMMALGVFGIHGGGR